MTKYNEIKTNMPAERNIAISLDQVGKIDPTAKATQKEIIQTNNARKSDLNSLGWRDNEKEALSSRFRFLR